MATPVTAAAQAATPAPLPSRGNSAPAPAKSPAKDAAPKLDAAHDSAEWRMLLRDTEDRHTDTRSFAIAALSSLGPDPLVLRAVSRALDDKEPSMREQAVQTLALLQGEAALPQLRLMLKDKSDDVVFAAALTLAQMRDPAGRDALVEFATGERRASGGALDQAKLWMQAQASNPKNLALTGASYASAFLLGPYSIPIAVAIELLRDKSQEARVRSTQALGVAGGERAVRVLNHELTDKKWEVRAAAAQALGAAGSATTIPALRKRMKDSKAAVRLFAAASILRLQANQQQPEQQAQTIDSEPLPAATSSPR